MYSKLPNLVLAFHGCSTTVADKVLLHGEPLLPSENTYDWLGHGIYFWEQSYERALEWAESHCRGDTPAVIGAVIDLGYCLNLTDSGSTKQLALGYDFLKYRCEETGEPMPQNRPSVKSPDVLLRDLDCAVIQHLHEYNERNNQKPFDSVRGIFFEGNPPYPGSEFKEKTHVQLCIINPNCIKGYFRPMFQNNSFTMP